MSLQDVIANALDPVKRKIYNKKLDFSGNEFRVIRLQISEDRYGDSQSITVINHEEIIVNMDNLEGIPLSRLRKNLSTPQATSQESLYLFDVLPIVVEPKLNTDIEKGDILIRKIYDENLENKPYYLVLRVLEPIGDFTQLSLIKLSYNCAPYIEAFDQEIVDLIEGY